MKRNGYIVLLVLMGGGSYQPIFHDDEGLMFFDTWFGAAREVIDCIQGTEEAVACGNMDDPYSIDDYRIVPATLENESIECVVDVLTYTMHISDDDYQLKK